MVIKKGSYDHHGIISEIRNGCEFKIVEATNTRSGAKAALLTSKSVSGKAKLECSLKKFRFSEENIGVVVYNIPRYSKERTASNAIQCYKYCSKHPKAYRYDLFTNNCEHFATYCVTGEMFSLQVKRFQFRSSFFFSKAKSHKDYEMNRNEELLKKKNDLYTLLRNE